MIDEIGELKSHIVDEFQTNREFLTLADFQIPKRAYPVSHQPLQLESAISQSLEAFCLSCPTISTLPEPHWLLYTRPRFEPRSAEHVFFVYSFMLQCGGDLMVPNVKIIPQV